MSAFAANSPDLFATARETADETYRSLDEPEVQSRFSRPARDAQLVESWLRIDGIVCASCAQRIERVLASRAGVASIRVNAAARRAILVWDPHIVRLSSLFANIAACGYRPYPVEHIGASMARRDTRRRALWRLFVAGFCMMQVMMYAAPAYFAEPGTLSPDLDALLKWASWTLSLPVMLFAAAPFFRSALADLAARHIGMDVPVALGIAITFVASSMALLHGTGEVYLDSLTMFVFLLLGGRYLEALARDKAAESLESLSGRLPDTVLRLTDYPASRHVERVGLHHLVTGDVLNIAPGQAFPGDGEVIEGESHADEALLSGENQPVAKRRGNRVVAGSFNLDAPLIVRMQQLGSESRLGQIVALMERAAGMKPRLASSADRVAAVFLPAVLVLAILAGLAWLWIDPSRAVWVAVSVLVVTCPCALSLAVPAAVLATCGRLARQGVLVCHPDALEKLSVVDHAVFDKTGTLSHESLTLNRVEPLRAEYSGYFVVALAAAMEQASLHPVAKALQAARSRIGTDPSPLLLTDLREMRGEGVEARHAGRRFRLGKARFACPGYEVPPCEGVAVVLADEHGPIAALHFGESLRPDAIAALHRLHEQGISTALLSGDREGPVAHAARALHIGEVASGQTPEDKLHTLETWQDGWRANGTRGCVLMVGDGINDGPVLSRADVSIAMGSGAPLSQSRADLVLLSGRLGDIPFAIDIARRMRRIVKQNLAWAAAYNAVCVPLALAGLMPPWLAGLGMAASSLLVVLNALRLAR